MYDPRPGVFITEDPIGFDGGDVNLNRYCGNDPVNRTDPTGESWNPFTWFDWGIDWSKEVDEELRIVRFFNQKYGTKHIRLDAFTPAERALIEKDRGQKIDWDNMPIKTSQGELDIRRKVLGTSEGCLWVAGAADAAAGGIVGIQIIAGAGTGGAAVSEAAIAGQRAAEAARSLEYLEMQLAELEAHGMGNSGMAYAMREKIAELIEQIGILRNIAGN